MTSLFTSSRKLSRKKTVKIPPPTVSGEIYTGWFKRGSRTFTGILGTIGSIHVPEMTSPAASRRVISWPMILLEMLARCLYIKNKNAHQLPGFGENNAAKTPKCYTSFWRGAILLTDKQRTSKLVSLKTEKHYVTSKCLLMQIFELSATISMYTFTLSQFEPPIWGVRVAKVIKIELSTHYPSPHFYWFTHTKPIFRRLATVYC